MAADLQSKVCSDLKQSCSHTQCRRYSAYFLFLSLFLALETFITACFLYDFFRDLHTTDESLRQGLYPTECLYQFLEKQDEEPMSGGSMASCELMKKEFQNSAQQRILLDIRNSLWQTLGEHNITQIFRPAIHLGAKQELKQYQHLQTTGDPETAGALQRLDWETLSRQSGQEGLLLVSRDGEIVVPQDGIYFVYSQVYLERGQQQSGRDLQVLQYLFKRTAQCPEPAVLTRAAATPCLGSKCGMELYSSHQGALFNLQRGDRLSLYVLSVTAMRFLPEFTYFGAFMID